MRKQERKRNWPYSGFLWLLSLLVIYPLAMVLLTSLKEKREANALNIALPRQWLWENYVQVLQSGRIMRSFFNSVFISAITVLLVLTTAALLSYAIERRNTRVCRIIDRFLTFGIIAPFAAMPSIVAEGRRVINNIQRAATLFLVKNIFSLFLSVISLFTDWPYPLQPVHLTVISALTIGIPSFFLAMEPNYDRVTGHFLRGVLRRAFPGGLTNVFAVLVCQAFMVVFDLPAASIATVCAGILAVVGMMVLFQVCKPFGAFRRIVWGGMLVCLVVVFTCLGELFELRSGTVQTNLLMLTLLLMTPTVFFAIQRLFDWGEKIFRRVFRRETA